MAVINEEQRVFFMENGYVKIDGLVSKENCDRVIDAIWECLGGDRSDPEDWYNAHKQVLSSAGMVEMYHHQSMWNNRQNPLVHRAFAELLGETRLWVSIDRVNMKPPARKDRRDLDYGFIHWDVNTANLPHPLPRPYGLQGVLYLEDTAKNQGGFQCVPSIYRDLEQYLKSQPADRNPRVPDLTGHEVEVIPGKAGDLLIWDRLLPHGNGHNYADKPRYAQYITMFPANPANPAARSKAIECWRHRQAPPGEPFPGDPRNWEQSQNSEPPELTQLGRKLLGLDAWQE